MLDLTNGVSTAAITVMMTWQSRGWRIQLVPVQDGWVMIVETPNAFVMDVPNECSGAMGLHLHTAPQPTPEQAIIAAWEVLR